jgi:hypothetical protein
MTMGSIPTKEEIKKMTMKGGESADVNIKGGGSGAVYGIGMIGAWVYYFQRATTNQERVQAFFKGLAWPAFLVYELFMFLEKK